MIKLSQIFGSKVFYYIMSLISLVFWLLSKGKGISFKTVHVRSNWNKGYYKHVRYTLSFLYDKILSFGSTKLLFISLMIIKALIVLQCYRLEQNIIYYQ